MEMKQIKILKESDRVIHRYLGECEVKEVMWSGDSLFGVVIRPVNENGEKIIKNITGGHGGNFLEGSIRLLQLPQIQ